MLLSKGSRLGGAALALAPATVVTARALAPLPDLLGLAAPLVAPGGTMLFPKGAQVWGEIEAAKKQWRFEQRVVGTLESPILCLTDVTRV